MLDRIKDALPGRVIWDKGDRGSVRGLHVRVTTTGAKPFFLYYRTKTGMQRKPKLGDFGEISIGEARRRARMILDRVAVGDDPKAGWDAGREELTVEELFARTWTGHWDTPRYQASGRSVDVMSLWNNSIRNTFGRDRLSDVTPGRLREWHKGMADRIYAANRALEVLSRMFRYAEEIEIRKQNSNPCHLVKHHPERKRKRFATQEEIARIGPLLDKYAGISPSGVAFLYLLLYSGARPISIERAGWSQLKEIKIDGRDYGVLTFDGKTTEKTGQEETVILPPQAMKALNRLPRVEGYTITGIGMPARLWKKIRGEAGCPDLRMRDLRRTFATVGMSGGLPIGIIGELLNHHSDQTTKIYAKVNTDRKMEATTSIANQLERMMENKESLTRSSEARA